MTAMTAARDRMVRTQIEARGVRDIAVLEAFRTVPREAFLPPGLAEFAYEDAPLPIAEEQTISQPYIVALMTAALQLGPQDRVLEVGTGSGYAAAILGRVAAEVYTIERHDTLAQSAAARLRELGYTNVHVTHGDGTLGWAAHAPYDAIVVAAGGPEIPKPLLSQLAPGGRLVIPVGHDRALQHLVRVTRRGDQFEQEELGDVRFVPLIGAEGWQDEPWTGAAPPARRLDTTAHLLRESAYPITGALDRVDPAPFLDRIGNASVVCIGEATHGTAEFYAFRAHLTRALIRERGFSAVAVEADWPDAARIDRYVRGAPPPTLPEPAAFARFPRWMWRNQEVLGFVEWLREWNHGRAAVGFYGLDLYSLYRSIELVVAYLDRIDPPAGRVARERYGRLMAWEGDPATYGRAVLSGKYRDSEENVVAMLRDLLAREFDYAARDGLHFLDATGNARVVANAERYYRIMYYGGPASWNLRDQHMFETLQAIRENRGPAAKVVVWAHNSHVGNAAATEMGVRGEWNIGQLCRQGLGADAYLIGFGTDHGTVAAAHDWDGPMQVMSVRPARAGSYEALCHTAGLPAFTLPLRDPRRPAVREELAAPLLERAIGVIYRPDTELQSHYFHAVLPQQFDEWIWFDGTHAVHPLTAADAFPRAHPFSGAGRPER
jgi:protein-L-isoaspartate(D-aspartate) O-methyltransferase